MNMTPKPSAQASFFERRKGAIRKGAIVVLFAILLPVQMIFLGFCIDFANMHRVRNEARVIADLSSKAAADALARSGGCLLYTSPSPRDLSTSRMPSSA